MTSTRSLAAPLRLEIEPLLQQYEHERSKAREERRQDWEWERYLSCSHVPHPKDRIAMSEFMTQLDEKNDTKLEDTHSVPGKGEKPRRGGVCMMHVCVY